MPLVPISQNTRVIDNRRTLVAPGDREETILFSAHYFLEYAKKRIDENGVFTVALAGGSTPQALYQQLTRPIYSQNFPWDKVKLFWSDERCVAPDHINSNYRMSMEAGFQNVAIPAKNIFRMPADREDREEAAKEYETLLRQHLFEGRFDLILLGMGDDGHTASLFSNTEACTVTDRWVVPNYVPQMKSWRLTLTFPCINQARLICLYVLGDKKATMLREALQTKKSSSMLPAYHVGAPLAPALWIADEEAAKLMLEPPTS